MGILYKESEHKLLVMDTLDTNVFDKGTYNINILVIGTLGINTGCLKNDYTRYFQDFLLIK